MRIFMNFMLFVYFVVPAPPAFGDEPPTPSAEFDANHCELYVNSFGVAHLRYTGHDERNIDADLVVDEAQLVDRDGSRVLRAGMGIDRRRFTLVLEDGRPPTLGIVDSRELVDGQRGFAGSYRVLYTFEQRGDPQTVFDELQAFAFFVDVKTAGGDVVRFWQLQRGARFTIEGVFSSGLGSTRSLGIGEVRNPESGSTIYDQRAACAPTRREK